MKLLRPLLIIPIALLACKSLHAQSFSVSFPDTIVYGAALDSNTISCWNNDVVTNLTENPLLMDVVRVQNDTGTPGWTSSFCFQFCSLAGCDSIRTTLQANEVVNIAIHFDVTSTPDTGTVLMKYQSVSNPSEVIYQRFYAITTPAAVGNSPSEKEVAVTCYPQPANAGSGFKMNIEGTAFSGQTLTLNVFDIYGRQISSVNGLHSGVNSVALDLPAGVYTYTLTAGVSELHVGKLVLVN